MIGWLRHHWFSFAQTARRLAANPVASLLNALAIGVALTLPLGGYVLLVNLQHFAGSAATEAKISVFLAQDAVRAEVAEVEARLRATPGVRSVGFVGRDAALAGLKRTPGIAEVVATLPENPLPDAFVVTLAARDPELARRLEQQFGKLPKVAHAQADSAWVERINSLIGFGRTAVLLTAALLAFALVTVTFNTIRLQILTQRTEIEVGKLVGATDSYIRRPFFYLGALQGALGGLAAWGIVELGIVLLNRDLAVLSGLYAVDMRLQLLDSVDGLAILTFAAALGWLGAYASVSRHLYQIEPS